jgi:hypothetical protein
VEDFVDLCVAVWEAAGSVGEAAGWVIDVRIIRVYLLCFSSCVLSIDIMVGYSPHVQLPSNSTTHESSLLRIRRSVPS